MTVEKTLEDIESVISDRYEDEELSDLVSSLRGYVLSRDIDCVAGQFQLLLVMSAALGFEGDDFSELINHVSQVLNKIKK